MRIRWTKSDSSESRSRSQKGCVNRGLGQRLNKQRNHSFRESGMDGFSHLYIQMHCLRVVSRIPDTRGKQCMCGHKTLPRQKSQAMLMARHMRKTLISAPADLSVSCLLGNLPSPLNHKFLVSCAPCGRLFDAEFDFISQKFYFRVGLGLHA